MEGRPYETRYSPHVVFVSVPKVIRPPPEKIIIEEIKLEPGFNEEDLADLLRLGEVIGRHVYEWQMECFYRLSEDERRMFFKRMIDRFQTPRYDDVFWNYLEEEMDKICVKVGYEVHRPKLGSVFHALGILSHIESAVRTGEWDMALEYIEVLRNRLRETGFNESAYAVHVDKLEKAIRNRDLGEAVERIAAIWLTITEPLEGIEYEPPVI